MYGSGWWTLSTEWKTLATGRRSSAASEGRFARPAHRFQRSLAASHQLYLPGGLVQQEIETARDGNSGLRRRECERSRPWVVHHIQDG